MFSKNLTNEFIDSEIQAKADENESVRDYKQNMLKLVINASSGSKLNMSGMGSVKRQSVVEPVKPPKTPESAPARVSKSVEHSEVQRPIASKFGISYL